MHAARPFKQNGVARLVSDPRHMPSGFCGVVEKKRGAGPKACTLGCVQRATGRAAYSDEHINPLLRGVSAYVAMQGLGPAAKFEHLPQNRDPPPRRRVPQHVQHGPHRIRIGVVAIVINQNAAVVETAPRAFFRAQVSEPRPSAAPAQSRKSPPPRSPPEYSKRCGGPSAPSSNRVSPTRKRTPSSEYSTSSARTCASADCPYKIRASRERQIAATRASSAFSTAVPARRQRFDQLPLRRGDSLDRIEKFDVRVADVGHHADIRPRDRRQLANFAGVIHAHFDHRDLARLRPDAEATSGSPT